MGKMARAAEPLYEQWRDSILTFAREGMNFNFTNQQESLFTLVEMESTMPIHDRKKRIAVRSGQGPGKTAASVIVALWRCLQYEDALVIVTSPSMRQCKQWVDECNRLTKTAHPIIRKMVKCYGTKVEINGSKMWGIRTATATRPENLQGIHEKHLTFIADEASGVSAAIIETIKGTLSNPDSLFLAIGNPNTSSCAFYDFFNSQADQWHTLVFNAEDTARDYPHIVSPSRNLQLEAEYGRDSDQYRIRVLGEFPHEDPNNVLGVSDVYACQENDLEGCSLIDNVLEVTNCFGIDVARYGSDESVVARRKGLALVDFETFVKREPADVLDWAFSRQADAGWENKDCWYVPDAGGMGQGIIANFRRSGKQYMEFHTQGRPHDRNMFADLYSEAWWGLRRLVKERIVYLPKDNRLVKQLTTRQYMTDKNGKIKVESKDEWRKRMEITESPDRADAVVMAFYPHLGTRARVVAKGPRSHQVGGIAQNPSRFR